MQPVYRDARRGAPAPVTNAQSAATNRADGTSSSHHPVGAFLRGLPKLS